MFSLYSLIRGVKTTLIRKMMPYNKKQCMPTPANWTMMIKINRLPAIPPLPKPRSQPTPSFRATRRSRWQLLGTRWRSRRVRRRQLRRIVARVIKVTDKRKQERAKGRLSRSKRTPKKVARLMARRMIPRTYNYLYPRAFSIGIKSMMT